MVKYDDVLDSTFAALADGTRRQILAMLAGGELTVTRLAEPFAMSLPAVSKHLTVLERAGLLTRTRQGRVRPCRLRAEALKDAAAWIGHYRQFWEGQLEALADFIEHAQPKENRKRGFRSSTHPTSGERR